MEPSAGERPFDKVLSVLETLLRKYGHDFHADYIASMGDLWPSDKATFRYRACDSMLWGGSGSVFDICFAKAGISKGEIERDQWDFLEALAELVQTMGREGFGTSSATEVESMIRHWHRKSPT